MAGKGGVVGSVGYGSKKVQRTNGQNEARLIRDIVKRFKRGRKRSSCSPSRNQDKTTERASLGL